MSSMLRRRSSRRPRLSGGKDPHSLNLVPMVDVLTSIVFFGLVTYAGARGLASLTAFDLIAPPVAGAQEPTRSAATPAPPPALTLRVDRSGVSVARLGSDSTRRFAGFSDATLRELNRVMTEHARSLPQDAGVSIIPADDLAYSDLIKVLDEVRSAGLKQIALGLRPRS